MGSARVAPEEPGEPGVDRCLVIHRQLGAEHAAARLAHADPRLAWHLMAPAAG